MLRAVGTAAWPDALPKPSPSTVGRWMQAVYRNGAAPSAADAAFVVQACAWYHQRRTATTDLAIARAEAGAWQATALLDAKLAYLVDGQLRAAMQHDLGPLNRQYEAYRCSQLLGAG